jgi:hypothetical protein
MNAPPIPAPAQIDVPDYQAARRLLRSRLDELREAVTMEISAFTAETGIEIRAVKINCASREWRNPFTRGWQIAHHYTLNILYRLPR